ncbi:MFS transporter [Treponema zioleckii]|uniref:MFS transporter n=1 Tax=Treponema zioleckii TaxID=331680 RepID=UPI0018D97F78|nr:glycoside-pentoside-hexuronide (GPH):cation symporter [Treponema zioleckii]
MKNGGDWLSVKKGLFMEIEKEIRPFGLRDKIGYMFGDCGNDFSFMLCAMFLMKFYTDIMGVSAAVVGLMMMVAKFVDAFTDVFMGQVCDRSPVTKKGKFLPWIRRMMAPVAISCALIFAFWFRNMPMAFKIGWLFFTYLLYGSVCYTAINIPYGSMASAITADPKQRTSLSTFRGIGAKIAITGIGSALPLFVFQKDATGKVVFSGEHMFGAAVVCGIIGITAYSLCYFLTTERVKMKQVTKKFELGDFFKTILSSRALLGMIACALVLLVTQNLFQGMNNYIYPNYFKNREAMSLVSLLGTATMLAISTFASSASGKIGKKEFAIIGSVIGSVAMFVAYFVHTQNVVVWIGFQIFGEVGLASFNLLCWAMITDVIDDMEIKNGERNDGSVYAVYSFARKLGQAFSAGLTGFMLSLIGYTKESAFDESVTNGIYDAASLAPAIAFGVMALALFFLYPLNKKRVEENSVKLHGGR